MTNLLLAREEWTAGISDGHNLEAIFIDFKKAFDMVPHTRLLHKLCMIGIDGFTVRWIQDFLNGRTFVVQNQNVLSMWREMPSGVPQGSVLGPLLFVICINDLSRELNSPCLMYADDLKIWRVIMDENDKVILQDDLDRLTQWSITWQLPINTSKCVRMKIA